VFGEPVGPVQRRRATDVFAEEVLELRVEVIVVRESGVALGELLQRPHQRFGNVPTAVVPKPAGGVRHLGGGALGRSVSDWGVGGRIERGGHGRIVRAEGGTCKE